MARLFALPLAAVVELHPGCAAGVDDDLRATSAPRRNSPPEASITGSIVCAKRAGPPTG